MSHRSLAQNTYPRVVDLTAEVTGTLPVAKGGTGSTTEQDAINTLTGVLPGDVGKVYTVDGSDNGVWTTVEQAITPDPATPSIAKSFTGNVVRFTLTSDTQYQIDEKYRFDLYDVGGSAIVVQKTISATRSGSSRLRDKWVEFTEGEQLMAGYTPAPTETFWIDAIQLGDFNNSASIKQEL